MSSGNRPSGKSIALGPLDAKHPGSVLCKRDRQAPWRDIWVPVVKMGTRDGLALHSAPPPHPPAPALRAASPNPPAMGFGGGPASARRVQLDFDLSRVGVWSLGELVLVYAHYARTSGDLEPRDGGVRAGLAGLGAERS